MSQVLAYILPVALLREFLASVVPFVLGAGISLYVFHYRRGSKPG